MRGICLLERSEELHPSLLEVHAPFQDDYVHPVGPHASLSSWLLPVVVCSDLFCFTWQQTRKACAYVCSSLNIWKNLKRCGFC